MLKLALVFSFFAWNFFGASLFLINDSDWPLTAEIRGADGTVFDAVSLPPSGQKRWSTELSESQAQMPSEPAYSLTPFTVVWRCPQKGTYSVCSNVQPGATVTANSCQGNYRCTTPEELKEQRENIEPLFKQEEKSK
ncbi:MAG: hypothetical protein WC371_05265 [Parachlamydiales bacterium]|jgi:hypothetical protein